MRPRARGNVPLRAYNRVPHSLLWAVRHIKAPVPHLLLMGLLLCAKGCPTACGGSVRAHTIHIVNRDPVIERIVTTASPIDIATVADACDVDDSMEERPLFPVTRSAFPTLGSVG